MNWQELKQASLNDIVAWAETQPWCRAMADCAQDAEWHSEGDVWTHTKMVCQQLAKLEAWPTLTSKPALRPPRTLRLLCDGAFRPAR